MLMEVGYFCEKVESDLASLVDELSEITNRRSTNEILSWQRSLPKLSIALSQPSLQDYHISFGQSGNISLEYKLPAASSWCDAVLLGNGDSQPSAVMVELKDWDTRGTKATKREGLFEQRGIISSHPSDQVRGYAEYCQNFHSTVLENSAQVAGCVLFTASQDLDVFRQHPYNNLVNQYPVFSSRTDEIKTAFPKFLSNYLKKPNYKFAKNFENGIYAQNRSLVQQIASLVLDESKSIFVLLDEQRRGFEMCLDEIDQILSSTHPEEKAVIIIEGPPGSGKSVLAAQLWATLVKDQRIKNSVVMTSTSSAQNSNWKTLFKKQSRIRAGKGVIVKSNHYNPGLTYNWRNRKKTKNNNLDIKDWRENIKLYLQENQNKMPNNTIEVSIVDEAHALIDPTVPGRRGVRNSGWIMHAGPQGYHIIRSSRISIFLMDSEQSYRDNETTDKESLKEWADELGVKYIQEISLGEAQFRCGGSKEYIAWLESLLNLNDDRPNDLSWRKLPEGNGSFLFEIVDTPKDLDIKLNEHHKADRSVRIVASYGREWKTKNVNNPHDLPEGKKDFYIPYQHGKKTKYWSRIWNYTPKAKYQYYVQAPAGTKMQEDPLCEVGCPYVVRGFDYDYLGVLWLKDLVWRENKWMSNLDSIYESAWNITLGRARKESRKGIIGKETEEIIKNLQKGYRILLSRAIRGIYVWFEDEETRLHVEKILNQDKT